MAEQPGAVAGGYARAGSPKIFEEHGDTREGAISQRSMGCGPGLFGKEEHHGVQGRVGGRNAGQGRFDKL